MIKQRLALILAASLGLVFALAACAVAPRPTPATGKSQLQDKLERADQALRDARLTDAEILYRQLTESNPELPDVWLRLGNVYTRESQLQAAVRTYKQGLHYGRNDGRLWYNLALARLKQSVDALEASSEVLPADSPYRPRIRALHQALLNVGKTN